MRRQTMHDRVREAYLVMAKEAHFRPAAPSDQLGGRVLLTKKQVEDKARLEKEATDYANQFLREEKFGTFMIGKCNFDTNRAFVYAIEAARLLAGIGGTKYAYKLLEMALKDIETEVPDFRTQTNSF